MDSITNNKKPNHWKFKLKQFTSKQIHFTPFYYFFFFLKGERFEKESILDVRTHYKPTETFQYTNYNSCHPAGVKKGFVKGEALRLLRTNSSKVMFEENIKNFRTRLTSRGYPNNLVDKIISEVKFAGRNLLHKHRKRTKEFYPSAL